MSDAAWGRAVGKTVMTEAGAGPGDSVVSIVLTSRRSLLPPVAIARDWRLKNRTPTAGPIPHRQDCARTRDLTPVCHSSTTRPEGQIRSQNVGCKRQKRKKRVKDRA